MKELDAAPQTGKGGSVLSRKSKDTDYLSISARVRAMENRLVTRERMERMMEARTRRRGGEGPEPSAAMEELARLTDQPCAGRGAGQGPGRGLTGICAAAVPDKRLVDVFQMKYDYHNTKALIKAEAVGADADLPAHGGRAVELAQVKLTDAFRREELRDLQRYLPHGGGARPRRRWPPPRTRSWPTSSWIRPILQEMIGAAKAVGTPFLDRLCAPAGRCGQPALGGARAPGWGRGAIFSPWPWSPAGALRRATAVPDQGQRADRPLSGPGRWRRLPPWVPV